MFEVGKKYIGQSTGKIRECVHVSESGQCVLRDRDNFLLIVRHQEIPGNHREYHEPVVEEIHKTVVKTSLGLCVVDRPWESDVMLGKISIVLTDGKLTDVKIL